MPRRTVARAMAGALLVFAVALGATACGDNNVDRAKLISKLKSDPEVKNQFSTDKQYGCLADIMIKYADKDDLGKYVDGKIKADQIKTSSSENDINKSAQQCAK